LPPEEPPGVRVGSHGLRAVPSGPSVTPQMHSSGTRVFPTTTAPAARSRATTGSSPAAGRASTAGEPCRVGSPATSTLSLMATGHDLLRRNLPPLHPLRQLPCGNPDPLPHH